MRYTEIILKAMDCLTRELCTCAPDSKHEKDLLFTFCYEEEKRKKGSTNKRSDMFATLKLIRDDSNLRIYFYWKDDEIGLAGKS